MGRILKAFKKHFVEQIIESLAESVPTYLYVFASKHTPWPDESTPPTENDSMQESTFDPLSEMMFGKKLTQSDVAYLIRRIEWTSGTVYDSYDHREADIFSKSFYVVTDEKKVYKCISNNSGAESTEKPTLTQSAIFQTMSDGYQWKYMFTIDNTSWNKFTSTNYVPVVANSAVANAAKASIDVILIESGGTNYKTFHEGLVKSLPNTSIFQLDDTASTSNRFYNGCAVHIYTGAGSGTIRTVNNYIVNSSGKWIRVDSAMSGIVPNNSRYRIAPRCEIYGDGTGAQAVLFVDTTNPGYPISAVEVVNTGTGYSKATIAVVGNTSFGAGANLTAIIPPIGGHGANPASELGTEAFSIYAQFANTESNTIYTEMQFRQVGILKNPTTYANAAVKYTGNTFNQVFACTPSTPVTFNVGEEVVGGNSEAIGTVIFSNTTVLMMSGDKHFVNTELIVGQTSGTQTNILNILNRGDITPSSPEILYVENILANQRANNQTEAVKLVIKL
jgi:hypothetical protein